MNRSVSTALKGKHKSGGELFTWLFVSAVRAVTCTLRAGRAVTCTLSAIRAVTCTLSAVRAVTCTLSAIRAVTCTVPCGAVKYT